MLVKGAPVSHSIYPIGKHSRQAKGSKGIMLLVMIYPCKTSLISKTMRDLFMVFTKLYIPAMIVAGILFDRNICRYSPLVNKTVKQASLLALSRRHDKNNDALWITSFITVVQSVISTSIIQVNDMHKCMTLSHPSTMHITSQYIFISKRPFGVP